jgi:hypothetical protein
MRKGVRRLEKRTLLNQHLKRGGERISDGGGMGVLKRKIVLSFKEEILF